MEAISEAVNFLATVADLAPLGNLSTVNGVKTTLAKAMSCLGTPVDGPSIKTCWLLVFFFLFTQVGDGYGEDMMRIWFGDTLNSAPSGECSRTKWFNYDSILIFGDPLARLIW